MKMYNFFYIIFIPTSVFVNSFLLEKKISLQEHKVLMFLYIITTLIYAFEKVEREGIEHEKIQNYKVLKAFVFLRNTFFVVYLTYLIYIFTC